MLAPHCHASCPLQETSLVLRLRNMSAPPDMLGHADFSGVMRPLQTAAHHIVAGGDRRAAEAKAILERQGIGINDAINGAFLPRFTSSINSTGAAVHATLHTNRYYSEVNRIVAGASSRQEVEAA